MATTWTHSLGFLAKLARLKMTVFSAVTYAVGASLAVSDGFDSYLFLAGWAFVFSCQLVAHFLGEYYDIPSDKLNCHSGPLTGGSKVLVQGDVTPRQCFALGYACLVTAAAVLIYVLPRRCWTVGVVLLVIAHQYSAPPLRCNHRGLGELSASLATNALLPQFAVLVQSSASETPMGSLMFHSSLAMVVVPAFFLKFGLFLALNMADRRPDWLAGKNTLPVLLGDETCARMIGACSVLAYLSAIFIYLMGLSPATLLAAVLMTAPEALSIAGAFNPSWTRVTSGRSGAAFVVGRDRDNKHNKRRRPYRLQGLVLRVVTHAPGVVVALFGHTVILEVFAAVATVAAERKPGAAEGPAGALIRWMAGVGVELLLKGSLPVRCIPVLPFVYLFFFRKRPRLPASTSPQKQGLGALGTSAASMATSSGTIIVAGGGVGGLVLGACLQQLGLPFQVLEKYYRGKEDGGADLALWPAATKVLKELGVGSNGPSDGNSCLVDSVDFWERKTYPVRRVRISKVDDTMTGSETGAVPVDAEGDHVGNDFLVETPQSVLKAVDMDAVVDGEGEPFRLVGRQAIMDALLPLVEERHVRPRLRVVRAKQSLPPAESKATVHVVRTRECGKEQPEEEPEEETISCRVLVGADGINSVCRMEVFESAAAVKELGITAGVERPESAPAVTTACAVGPRDGGETCYRGVLDLREVSPGATTEAAGLRRLFERDEKECPASMSIVYGDRIRFSWGFIDGARDTGYWFVKQLAEKRSKEGKERGTGTGIEDDGVQGKQIGEAWPEPLRTFARMTVKERRYVHRIQDRPPLERWSSGNITLLGDACHPAAPNNGQGACMAIEDAFVLAILLREYWDQPDGHVEAFYQYERARRAHTRGVQRDSLRQMKLGQLTSRMGIWLRELAIRAVPVSVVQKKLRATNVFDIDDWLERFRALKAERV